MSVTVIGAKTCCAKRPTDRGCASGAWSWWRAIVVLLVMAGVTATPAGEYQLDQIRRDVRTPPERRPEPSPSEDRRDHDHHHRRHRGPWDDDDELYGSLLLFGGYVFVAGVTSPYWYPHQALGDDLGVQSAFAQFPYDDVPGYLVIDRGSLSGSRRLDAKSVDGGDPVPEYIRKDYWQQDDPSCEELPYYKTGEFWQSDCRKRWACRLRVDYADTFDDVQRIGGHMLLSTEPRFEIDTSAHYLLEDLPDGSRDHLWLGDCNVVFRFAQSERAQFRSGIGFNWLADREDADFGFNFTYGADFFPRRPWVLSATLDWGTLGHAELFHFRTTAGVMIHRVETFVGYEYYDIDATQTNALIAGLRVWF